MIASLVGPILHMEEVIERTMTIRQAVYTIATAIVDSSGDAYDDSGDNALITLRAARLSSQPDQMALQMSLRDYLLSSRDNSLCSNTENIRRLCRDKGFRNAFLRDISVVGYTTSSVYDSIVAALLPIPVVSFAEQEPRSSEHAPMGIQAGTSEVHNI